MEALEWATSRDEQHRGDEMHSLFSPRYGWLHTCETMESWSLNARCNYDLRSQGYAFWDRARIKGLQQFRDPRARVEGMATDKFPAGHRSHSDGCKIAVEFAGVAIRKDAIRQFADEVDEKDSAADDGSDDADEDDKEEEEDTPYVISWRDDM
ncbi:hypothetical protein BDW74DRAFT_80335 [Aspergillus multicolor]|uniref:uncharacterized protein n=1 Tax=Aspergillus multicolor TaxID=41759 RepID=UPI003CCCAB04